MTLDNVGDVVSDQVDSGNLLEHLIDVCQHGSVEVAILCCREKFFEVALRFFQHTAADFNELVVDAGIVNGKIGQCCQNFQCFVFFALQDEPSRRLGKFEDEGEYDHCEEGLERQRESPSDGIWVDEEEGEIDPVADHDAARYHRAFDHDHLASTVRSGALRLPCGDRGCVETVACKEGLSELGRTWKAEGYSPNPVTKRPTISWPKE